jgi:soluble P-type ATPase
MLTYHIPGYKDIEVRQLVLDYNGTLAQDGVLMPGVDDRLKELSKSIDIHILTADTFGSVEKQTSTIPCKVAVLSEPNQDIGKFNYVSKLDPEYTVAIGNGRNDQLMLKAAVLGIATIQGEGAAMETLSSADIVVNDILAALDLLLNPLRLVATLRS